MSDELPIINSPDFDYRQCELFSIPKKDSKKCRTCGIEKRFDVFVNPYAGGYFKDCKGCRLRKEREKGRKDETKERREKRREHERNWQKKRDNEPVYRMKTIMQRWGGRGRLDWTCKVLGFTPLILKEYIESQWEVGMNWENFGKADGWQIDHITPRHKFNLNNIEEFKRCHALSNLRPLWTKLNQSRLRKS